MTVGRETVRRWLRQADLVWRRPRPTIRPKDPDREKKLRALRALLKGLPAGETAVFIANLAFDRGLIDGAKLGILLASVVSAAAGLALLAWLSPRGGHSRPARR